MRWFRHPRKGTEKGTLVVRESGWARLLRVDGRLMCECPYACLATYEPCEFAGYTE